MEAQCVSHLSFLQIAEMQGELLSPQPSDGAARDGCPFASLLEPSVPPLKRARAAGEADDTPEEQSGLPGGVDSERSMENVKGGASAPMEAQAMEASVPSSGSSSCGQPARSASALCPAMLTAASSADDAVLGPTAANQLLAGEQMQESAEAAEAQAGSAAVTATPHSMAFLDMSTPILPLPQDPLLAALKAEAEQEEGEMGKAEAPVHHHVEDDFVSAFWLASDKPAPAGGAEGSTDAAAATGASAAGGGSCGETDLVDFLQMPPPQATHMQVGLGDSFGDTFLAGYFE